MASKLGVELKVTRLLLDVGLMCAWLGKRERSAEIIDAVRVFRDDVPHPGAVAASALIFQGRFHEAIDELEGALSRFADYQLGKAMLALAYREVGHPAWRGLCRQVIDDGRDEWAINLAHETLGAGAPAALPTQRAACGFDENAPISVYA